MEQRRIDDLLQRLMENLPPALQSVRDDLKGHAERVLQAGLSKLDLVTREEFDAQSRVLTRSREMIERMEQRLGELEAQLKR